jgi:RNA polymerase sigma factor (sigma-70 family)
MNSFISNHDFNLITRKLVGVAKRRHGLHNAEDIAQEVLLYAFQAYKPEIGTFEGFCFMVLKGKALDFMRLNSRRIKADQLDGIVDQNGNKYEIKDNTAGFNDLADSFKERLTGEELQVANLRVEGYHGYEIANMVGKSTAWVSNTLEKIKSKIEKEVA